MFKERDTFKSQIRRAKNAMLMSPNSKEEIKEKTFNALADILAALSETKSQDVDKRAAWCTEVHGAISLLIITGDLKLVEYEDERVDVSKVSANDPQG